VLSCPCSLLSAQDSEDNRGKNIYAYYMKQMNVTLPFFIIVIALNSCIGLPGNKTLQKKGIRGELTKYSDALDILIINFYRETGEEGIGGYTLGGTDVYDYYKPYDNVIDTMEYLSIKDINEDPSWELK
jgi:hypothetical protein